MLPKVVLSIGAAWSSAWEKAFFVADILFAKRSIWVWLHELPTEIVARDAMLRRARSRRASGQ